MKTNVIHPGPESSYNFSGLYQLTDCLVNTLQPKATSNKSFFINEIPEQLPLAADRQMLASVLGGLLSAIAYNTKDSCIRLTAKTYGNVVLV